MSVATKSQNGTSAVLDEPLDEALSTEAVFPKLEPLGDISDAEVIFPALDPPRAPDTVAVPEAEATLEAKEVQKVGRPAAKRRMKRGFVFWAFAALFVAGILVGIVYLQRQSKTVLPRGSAAHSTHQATQAGSITGGNEMANMPEGTVQFSPVKQQLIGVQYGTVEYQTISKTLRAVGRLAYDETRITRINPKIEGWIEQVYVDFTGKLVRQGQPLISIYSPDLVQTQQEYLLAIKGRRELAESPFPEATNFSESLVQAARRRLELWDISEQQINEIEKRGTPAKAMTLYAPASGFVMTRNAFRRQRVTPETELYTIADLSTIWVIADIYEFEASEIREGQAATVTLSTYPGRAFRGKVTYIYPQLDNQTRTLRVRLELANPKYALKPDMFADVIFNIAYGSRLVVPQEAVMDSGLEQLVFVAHEGGYFESRKVQLGAKVDNKFIVLGGLQSGERVVTSGNFLIDSESKLKSATEGMGMPGMSHGSDTQKGK